MKVMGLIACTLAVCLVTASAQPLFLAPGVTAALGAGGLVISSAAIAASAQGPAVPAAVLATIPLAPLIADKAAVVGAGVAKGFLLKSFLDARAENEAKKNNKRE